MSIQCLIFDDEPAAISAVSYMLKKFAPAWKILGTASQAEACSLLLNSVNADVIFSDIHFGSEIVFDLLPELKDFSGDLVFISGHNNFASQAFELSAINYILKPVSDKDFMQTIEKIESKAFAKNNLQQQVLIHNMNETKVSLKKIAFNTSTGYIIKELRDILFAQAKNNYTEFHFNTGDKVIVAKTLLDYEKMLSSFGFVRIHQSYIVNFEYVEKFDTDGLQLYLRNKMTLPVSNRRKTLLLELIRKVF